MNTRRWLFLLLPALLSVVLILGWHLRELATATDESARELSTTRERLETTSRELSVAQEALQRERRERERLEGELRAVSSRIDRQTLIDEVTRAIEEIRGLKLKRPLRVRWVDRAFTQRFVREELERQQPPPQLAAYAETLARLGLLPAAYPLSRALEDLLGEQAAGFYDFRSATLYLRDDLPAAELTLAHEIAHALQDQHFDLRALLRPRLDHDDQAFAARALVEGDAFLTMEMYLRSTLSLWKVLGLLADVFQLLHLDQKKLEAAPLYLRETMLRSYIDGKSLVQALYRRGGWARVDRAYREPPASSKQVSHPARYLRSERPVAVELPALERILGSDWKAYHENTIGEIGVSALFRGAATTRARAEAAARGWAGDRLRSYRSRDGRLLVVWRAAWDTPRDAQEFQSALTTFLDERHGPAAQPRRLWRSGASVVLLATKGREVLLVEGAKDEALGVAVVGAVLGR